MFMSSLEASNLNLEDDVECFRIPLARWRVRDLVLLLHLIKLPSSGHEVDLDCAHQDRLNDTRSGAHTSARGTILVFLTSFQPAQQTKKMGRVI
jgi:hypothetical protein